MQILEAVSLEKSENQFKPWLPKRALFIPDALEEYYGQELYEKCTTLGIPIQDMNNNRLVGLRGETERETYRLAKSTLAIVKAPPSQLKLSPIPPSAD